MVNTVPIESISINDISELLQQQHAIISGGKSKEGCPIITFPDNNNFHLLTDFEYQRLMLYLASVPSLQEADLGFHLIIDRRKDRWNSVKTVLLKISVYFPGLIHVVYVLRPASFIQKALSEVSNKLFKDEFKFRMIVLSTIEELHEYIDLNQLTPDLGGTLIYSHHDWIQQRFELENFSLITQQVSTSLDEFTKNIDEIELPNDVDTTQQLLDRQIEFYTQLKDDILSAAKHGENLLIKIKNNKQINSDINGNCFAVERLLVQLEETERTFDDFWRDHSTKLRHCLELRQFEKDFRELQINFDNHCMKIDWLDINIDSTIKLDVLINDLLSFEKLCLNDVEKAEEVVALGQHLIQIKNCCPLECVEPKCNELLRIKDELLKKISKQKITYKKIKEFLERLDNANKWCLIGLNLLEIQILDNLTYELAIKYQQDIENHIKSSTNFIGNFQEFKGGFQEFFEKNTKHSQIINKIDDVFVLCEKRLNIIKNFIANNKPSITNNKIIVENDDDFKKLPSNDDDDGNKLKTRHALSELIETEKIYVSELLSIINGYKKEARSEEMQRLLPTTNILEKIDLLFGNLEEIYDFHSNIFVKDLENCISSIDLVALCFLQRRDTFYHLYSCYCQNIPRSEQIRENLTDCNMFFQTCQLKLGHKLPLAAYLLKPVQRITKYQLLLKDLLKYTNCKELQQALDCMLVVLKCVNDSMHQISIIGFPIDLSRQGDLLLQGSFSLWVDNKKDLKLRLKPLRRHIFLYQKSILFCKSKSKRSHNKATYQFKNYLKMSQIGLTESVKGDNRKFEVWLQGRQEVYTIQATNIEQKQAWVNEIKRVLFNQLEELKGEKIKQYSALINHKPLLQTTSWEKEKNDIPIISNQRTISCDAQLQSIMTHGSIDSLETGNWSSDCSNSDDEDHHTNNSQFSSGRYIALSDYCAVGNGEISMKEGDMVELLKVGCAGWWFVKIIDSSTEGWAPAAYLENLHRKTSRGSSKSHDKLNDHH